MANEQGNDDTTKTESPGEASSAPSSETLAARQDRARALLDRVVLDGKIVV